MKNLFLFSLFLGLVLFISGCEEGGPLFAQTHFVREDTPGDVDIINPIVGGGSPSQAVPLRINNCQRLSGSCRTDVGDGWEYELVCSNDLGCIGQSCFAQVGNSYCGATTPYGDCYCVGDGVCDVDFGETSGNSVDCADLPETHSICNVNGECVSVPGFGENQCSVNIDCLPESGCGDGIVQPYLLEECDGLDLNFESCISLGYFGGILSCNLDCTFNQDNCY